MDKFKPVLLVLLCASFFSLCDIVGATWGRKGGVLFLAGLFVLAPFSYLFFGYLCRTTSLAVMGGLVNLGIVVITASVSIFLFKEAVTLMQITGLLLACVSLYLLAP